MSNENVIIEGATDETVDAPKPARFKSLLTKIKDNTPLIVIATASLVTVGGVLLLNKWEKDEQARSAAVPEVPVVDVTL